MTSSEKTPALAIAPSPGFVSGQKIKTCSPSRSVYAAGAHAAWPCARLGRTRIRCRSPGSQAHTVRRIDRRNCDVELPLPSPRRRSETAARSMRFAGRPQRVDHYVAGCARSLRQDHAACLRTRRGASTARPNSVSFDCRHRCKPVARRGVPGQSPATIVVSRRIDLPLERMGLHPGDRHRISVRPSRAHRPRGMRLLRG